MEAIFLSWMKVNWSKILEMSLKVRYFSLLVRFLGVEKQIKVFIDATREILVKESSMENHLENEKQIQLDTLDKTRTNERLIKKINHNFAASKINEASKCFSDKEMYVMILVEFIVLFLVLFILWVGILELILGLFIQFKI